MCSGVTGPFRLYGGSLFSWKKGRKTACSHIRPLRCASGSPRSGGLRARAAYDLLRKSTSRAFGCAEGCYAPGPPAASTRPPEVAGRSRSKARSRARAKARATAGESLRSRFFFTFVLCCGGSRDLSFEDNASSAATHNGSTHDLNAKPSQAKPSQAKPSSPTIREEPKERGKPTMRIGFPHHHSISVQCSATALRLGASLFCSPGSSIGTSLPSASNSLPSLK